MRKNQRHALDALFSGKDLNFPSLIVDQRGECIGQETGCYDDLPTIYSYGSHFPLIILDDALAYLNTGKYSATTSSQQAGCSLYLHYEGFRETGQTITHRGHTFAVYQLTDPESWPDLSSYSGSYDRPAHHNQEG